MPKKRANGEGSLFERRDGRWAAQYTDNAGKKRTLYGKTQQEVKNKLKEAIRQSDTGINVDMSKITVAEWLSEWLEVYAKPTIRSSTYDSYYTVIHKHIIPAFPDVPLKDLRADMVQKFFNQKAISGRLDKAIDPITGKYSIRQGGLSPSTLKRMRVTFIAALDKAVEDSIILHNVARKVKLPPVFQNEVPILSTREQKKLEAEVLKSPNPIAFSVIISLYTGLRIGELVALKISDIDFDRNELYVQRSKYRVQTPKDGTKVSIQEPKSQKGKRRIPLPVFLVDMLRSHIDSRNMFVDLMREQWKPGWEDNGFLFVTAIGTTPDSRSVTILFERLLKQAGVKHIKFHALRHTFATRALEAGFDIKSLADILGHADVKITLNTYAHALPDQKRNNMNKFSLLAD